MWILKDADVTDSCVIDAAQISDSRPQLMRIELSLVTTRVERLLVVVRQLHVAVNHLATLGVARRTCDHERRGGVH